MRKYNGSALVDYVIPTALVGLVVGMGLYGLSTNGNILNFAAASGNMEIQLEADQAIIGGKETLNTELYDTLKGGSLGGTKDLPVQTCNNSKCTIDFGSFVLTNIPENYNEFVETSGVSSSTDKVAELIKQISDQLTNDGKPEEAEQIMQLANLGHNLAVLQNYAEAVVSNCNNDNVCIQAEFTSPMEKPAGYDESSSPFPDNVTYEELSESLFDIGRARNYKTENPDEYISNVSNDRLAYLIVDKYDTIMDNPGVGDSVKGVLQELFWSIGAVSEDFDNNLSFLMMDGNEPCQYFDPVTGEAFVANPGSDPFADFENYNASRITHFDSSLICGASMNQDTGTSCH